MRTNIYTSESNLNHRTGAEHPERPARLAVILDLLREEPFSRLPIIEAKSASLEALSCAHSIDYVNRIRELIPKQGLYDLDGEVILSSGTWDAALHAVGAVCQAVGDVTSDVCRRAFCAVRPPGHHATRDKAMGFCIFANALIGARFAQKHCSIKKVVIIDFDVHHGNGTQSMATEAQDILFISSHQYPLWPGTGASDENVADRVINLPLAPFSSGQDMRRVYENIAFPAIDLFAPELVIISAGFDAHERDPLAQLQWNENDYAWLTEKISELSLKHAKGRIISCLEGGYDLDALKSSVAVHLRALADL